MALPAAAAAGENVVAAPPGVSECQMETAGHTADLLTNYAAIAEELRSWGDVAGASSMETQVINERRRVRDMSREDPALQRAMSAYKDACKAAVRKDKRQRDLEAQLRARKCSTQECVARAT